MHTSLSWASSAQRRKPPRPSRSLVEWHKRVATRITLQAGEQSIVFTAFAIFLDEQRNAQNGRLVRPDVGLRRSSHNGPRLERSRSTGAPRTSSTILVGSSGRIPFDQSEQSNER